MSDLANGNGSAEPPVAGEEATSAQKVELSFELLYLQIYEHAKIMAVLFETVGRLSHFQSQGVPALHPAVRQLIDQRDQLNAKQGEMRMRLEELRAHHAAAVIEAYEEGGGSRKIVRATVVPVGPSVVQIDPKRLRRQ